QTGPLRIEQSPAMSPKAPVPSVSARVDRGVGKNRRYEWRERIEQSPAHERLVLEIHADLERGGLAHHSRPALPNAREVRGHADVTVAGELQRHLLHRVAGVDPHREQRNPLGGGRRAKRQHDTPQAVDQRAGRAAWRAREFDLTTRLEGYAPPGRHGETRHALGRALLDPTLP